MENIIFGEESNIQDLSMGHADPGFPLVVGNRVTIGHHCVLHGCVIEDDCLIGMGAIIMNGVRIKMGSIIEGSVCSINSVNFSRSVKIIVISCLFPPKIN